MFSVFFIIYFINTNSTISQNNQLSDSKNGSIINYDIVPVYLILDNEIINESDIIYFDDESVFIYINDFFTSLEVNINESNNGKTIFGFINNENNIFEIDFESKSIKYQDVFYQNKENFIYDNGRLAIESTLLDEVFGISVEFNFRLLSLIIESKEELPIEKRLRLSKIRQNIKNISNDIVLADTIVNRNYHFFQAGVIDWNFNLNQGSSNLVNSSIFFGFGSEFLYGETNVSLFYNNNIEFSSRNVNYNWRWVDNSKNDIKQVEVGMINSNSAAFINDQFHGVSVTNKPTTLRKLSGTYTISDFTNPNWLVELYMNQQLVDYQKADDNGLFLFDVPYIYGTTDIMLKFYGPSGEEKLRQFRISNPVIFVPKNEFEYKISSGIINKPKYYTSSDEVVFGNNGTTSNIEINYGVSNKLTFGGAFEYLDYKENQELLTTVKTSLLMFDNLVFTGKYIHDLSFNFSLNYNFRNNLNIHLDYIKQKQNQTITMYNYIDEGRFIISKPFKINKVGIFAKLDISRSTFVFNEIRDLFVGTLSASYVQLSLNTITEYRTSSFFISEPIFQTQFNIRYNLPKSYSVNLTSRYDYNLNYFMSYGIQLTKNHKNGDFRIGFQEYPAFKNNFLEVSLRYDFNFLRASTTFFNSNSGSVINENIGGSIVFDSENNHTEFINLSSMRRGGVVLKPFIDVNHNSVFDNNEKRISVNLFEFYGGQIEFDERDTLIRISNLNPFTNYSVKFSNDDLDNIAWRFKDNSYSITIDPNQYKTIDIPIVSVGEVSGDVIYKEGNNLDGAGRIIIEIYDQATGDFIVNVLSESDGYIYYLGLKPGKYIAKVSEDQLQKIDYKVYPSEVSFQIKEDYYGDIVEGLKFELSNK